MKKKLDLIYKIIIMVVSGISLYLNFQVFGLKEALVYFTVQSNLICFIFYVIITLLYLTKKLKKNGIYYTFKGMVTMAMAITMIVYQFFLSTGTSYDGHEFTCVLVHLIVPLLVVFDYIIFAEKGNLKKIYPYIWSLTLVFYLIFDVIYVALGGRFNGTNTYPYFFLNIDKFGVTGVAINCLIIYVIFILFGKLIQVIDTKIKEV